MQANETGEMEAACHCGTVRFRVKLTDGFNTARDEKVDTIECESAEAALAVMLIGGREVAMIFADVRLPGAMSGVDLAV